MPGRNEETSGSGYTSTECLQELIEPISMDEFVGEYYGRRYAHMAGAEGRFRGLYSWDRLNEVLALHRLQAPRLSLCRDGKVINPKLYQYASELRGNGMIIRSDDFVEEVAKGATIVIEEIEDTYLPLRQFVVALEDRFGAHIHANLYASWQTDNCFPIHWDPHDTFVIQIAGRKHWKIWPPTRKYPLENEDVEPQRPVSEPEWEGVLEDGSVFYLPRGWWHIAYSVSEPSLHITITLFNSTGMKFVEWVTERFSRHAIMRRDLPTMSSSEVRNAHAAELAGVFSRVSIKRQLLEFLDYVKRGRNRRPSFNFPKLERNDSSGDGP